MLQPRPARFQRTPPAIFPPIMGAFGLGLAWTRAEDALGLEPVLGGLILGAVTLLFVFGVLAYGAKVARRAGVVVEDLRVLPGRAGLAAASLSVALLAAALVPLAPELARVVLALAALCQVLLAGLVIRVLLTGPAEQRQVTPVFHLTFVGFILLPLSAVPLGFQGFGTVILAVTAAVAALIYAVSLGQLLTRDPPPPLRPLLAVHLAPASLFATVSALLGLQGLALAFVSLACVLFAALLARARYLTAAGFSPLWGAFTFPTAAFAGALLAVAGQGWGPGGGALALWAGCAVLAGVTVLVPVVLTRVLRLWARGELAPRTNAATA